MADRRVGRGRRDEAGAADEAREQVGRFGEDILHTAARASEAAFDGALVGFTRFAQLQQRVHEHAEAGMGGNAAGGGVRAVDQAHLGEVGHDVADRGG